MGGGPRTHFPRFTATSPPTLPTPPTAQLIYNGDQDLCIPYVQDELWTAAAGYAPSAPWHPWTVAGEVAGYVTEFAVPGKRFAFVTVKRAGHEVPMYQPARALAMMQRFVAGAAL